MSALWGRGSGSKLCIDLYIYNLKCFIKRGITIYSSTVIIVLYLSYLIVIDYWIFMAYFLGDQSWHFIKRNFFCLVL